MYTLFVLKHIKNSTHTKTTN